MAPSRAIFISAFTVFCLKSFLVEMASCWPHTGPPPYENIEPIDTRDPMRRTA